MCIRRRLLIVVVSVVRAGRLNSMCMLVVNLNRCTCLTSPIVNSERLLSLKKPLRCLIRLRPSKLC